MVGVGRKQMGEEVSGFLLNFSGDTVAYESGMTRERKVGLPRFSLLVPTNVPYEHTMVYRDAMLLTRGAENHGARNAELGNDREALDDFAESAGRHYFKWLSGMRDEDHAAALRWNVRQYEESLWRLENGYWRPE